MFIALGEHSPSLLSLCKLAWRSRSPKRPNDQSDNIQDAGNQDEQAVERWAVPKASPLLTGHVATLELAAYNVNILAQFALWHKATGRGWAVGVGLAA